MPSLYSRCLRPVVRLSLSRVLNSSLTIDQQRKNLSSLSKLGFPLRGVQKKVVSVNGVNAVWVTEKTATEDTVLLYLHGGGYVVGSIDSHADLAARLAAAAQGAALVLDYRLAPEHPYPAALEDSVAAYQWLLESRKIPADHIVIAGDSAGGGLALATALKIRDLGLPAPAGLFCISPWIDLTLSGDSVSRNQHREIMLTDMKWIKDAAQYYAADDFKNPYISPLYGNLRGLPPILIHVGSDEILLDDSVRLQQLAGSAGVSCEIKVWDGMWHVWHLFADVFCPESRQAIQQAGEFMQKVTGNLSGNKKS